MSRAETTHASGPPDGAYLLEYGEEAGILRVIVSGPRNKKTVIAAAREIFQKCREEDYHYVFIDVRTLRGRLSILDSVAVILDVFPEFKKHRLIKKAAILDRESERYQSRFFETFAANRAYNLRLFHCAEEALSWLKTPVTVPY
jgi:hypothetical protein